MKVTVKGKGVVNLTKNDFLAAGGEGSVYVKGATAYKVYTKIDRTIPEAKIKELSVLTRSNIIKPQDMLVNGAGVNCGYTMAYINRDDVFVLCELFAKAFKNRNQLTQDKLLKLIEIFQSTVKHCHDHNILLVDMNELNFLVPKTFDDFYFIDTDSYQTPSYRATAIMDSIRDRHCKNHQYTKETDWFSFGIVIFNLLTGIHPYKGKHSLHTSMDERMLHNLSVLNKTVSVPQMIGDLHQYIPGNYFKWFEAIFEKGLRCAPPTGADVVVLATPTKVIIAKSDNFVITQLFECSPGHTVVDLIDTDTILTTEGLYLHNKLDARVAPYAQVVRTSAKNHVVSAVVKNKRLSLYDVTASAELPCTITATAIMRYKNRLYIKQNEAICEISFMEGSTIVPTMHKVANIIEVSTQMFTGCAIQNLMNVYFASIFPEAGKHYQLKLPELAEHRIINAFYENQVLVVVASKDNQFTKFIFKLSKDYASYTVTTEQNVQNTEINLIILDNGVAIGTDDNGFAELFTNSSTNVSGKVIQDTIFEGNKLFHVNNNAYYAEGSKISAVRMK